MPFKKGNIPANKGLTKVKTAIDKDDTEPFMSLTNIKKQTVLLVGDTDIKSVLMTHEQKAAKLNIDADSLTAIMKDPIVLSAIREYRNFYYRHKIQLLYENDILQRYSDTPGKRLEKEDRNMIGKMFDMNTMPVVTANLTTRDNKLKGIL